LAIAQELVDAAANREVQSFLTWSERLPIPERGALDFELFPFQREWYTDEVVHAKQVCWIKATQVGVSEYGVRWSLYFPDQHGDRALYVFPGLRQLRDFSDARVRPLVHSEYLRTRVPSDSIDNKYLKDVGPGKWYARGSNNATDLDSVAGDVLCLDEYDDIVQANIPRAEKRLSSPLSRGLIRRFGVPRYSELGIHAEYEKSDQRRWHVTCSHCGEEAPMHFWSQEEEDHHYVDQERCERICWNCEEPLEPDDFREGRWVAKFPDRENIGYHVTRLILPTARVAEIVAESKKTKPFEIQEFWNSTLGLPFDPEEGRLSKIAILAATRDYYVPRRWDEGGYTGQNLVTAGVDVASVRSLNVRISEWLDEYTKRALFIGTVESFDDLAVIMQSYRVQTMLIDHLPDGRLARAMVNKFPGRCWTVSWGDRRAVFEVDSEMRTVSAQRTTTISAVLDSIRKQQNELPQNLPEDYVAHMRAAVLKKDEDDKGKVRVFYETMTDHDYLQAEGYDLLAGETFFWSAKVGDLQRETFTQLEEVVQFERSDLGGIHGPTKPFNPGPSPYFVDEDLEFDVRNSPWQF
jgi:hypothetical protein